MKRVEQIVKHLEMMGYDVVNNTTQEYIMIILRTRGGYGCYYSVYYTELERNYIVEHIVCKMNGKVTEDF